MEGRPATPQPLPRRFSDSGYGDGDLGGGVDAGGGSLDAALATATRRDRDVVATAEANDMLPRKMSFDGPVNVVNSIAQFGGNTIYHGPVTMVLPDGHADSDVVVTSATMRTLEEAGTGDAPRSSAAQRKQDWQSGTAWRSPRLWHRVPVLVGGLALVLTVCLTLVLVLVRGAADAAGSSGTGTTTTPGTPASVGLVSRQAWGAVPAKRTNPLPSPVDTVIIHHTATEACDEESVCEDSVRQMQRHHINERNWSDIAYNFLVGGDGHSYEGRGWDVEGAHTKGWNAKSLGVALIGNFCSSRLPARQLDALRRLLGLGEDLGKLGKQYEVLGRCQLVGGEVPGRALEDIKSLSHWSKNYIAACNGCNPGTTPKRGQGTTAKITSVTALVTSGTSLETTMVTSGTSLETTMATSETSLETTSTAAPLGTTPDPEEAAGGLVSRQGWGAQPPKQKAARLSTIPVKTVIIHHTATKGCDEESACEDSVRQIQRLHMDAKPEGFNWDDIGYNFLVGGDGHSYEGRGWDAQAAHTYGWNAKSLGVALIGNFCHSRLPARQLEALRRLLGLGEDQGKLARQYVVVGKCQLVGGSIPGQAMQDIKSLGHWSKNDAAKCTEC